MFMSMETSGILGVGRSSGRVDIFVLFTSSSIIFLSRDHAISTFTYFPAAFNTLHFLCHCGRSKVGHLFFPGSVHILKLNPCWNLFPDISQQIICDSFEMGLVLLGVFFYPVKFKDSIFDLV